MAPRVATFTEPQPASLRNFRTDPPAPEPAVEGVSLAESATVTPAAEPVSVGKFPTDTPAPKPKRTRAPSKPKTKAFPAVEPREADEEYLTLHALVRAQLVERDTFALRSREESTAAAFAICDMLIDPEFAGIRAGHANGYLRLDISEATGEVIVVPVARRRKS